jgi:hypothetical protein
MTHKKDVRKKNVTFNASLSSMTHLEVTCVETKGLILVTSYLSEARHWKIWEVLKHEFGCTTRYTPPPPPGILPSGVDCFGV